MFVPSEFILVASWWPLERFLDDMYIEACGGSKAGSVVKTMFGPVVFAQQEGVTCIGSKLSATNRAFLDAFSCI